MPSFLEKMLLKFYSNLKLSSPLNLHVFLYSSMFPLLLLLTVLLHYQGSCRLLFWNTSENPKRTDVKRGENEFGTLQSIGLSYKDLKKPIQLFMSSKNGNIWGDFCDFWSCLLRKICMRGYPEVWGQIEYCFRLLSQINADFTTIIYGAPPFDISISSRNTEVTVAIAMCI